MLRHGLLFAAFAMIATRPTLAADEPPSHRRQSGLRRWWTRRRHSLTRKERPYSPNFESRGASGSPVTSIFLVRAGRNGPSEPSVPST